MSLLFMICLSQVVQVLLISLSDICVRGVEFCIEYEMNALWPGSVQATDSVNIFSLGRLLGL